MTDDDQSDEDYADWVDERINGQPGNQPDIPESTLLARLARMEYEAMTPEERAEVDAHWAARPEWEKDDIRAAVEFDLL